MLHNATLIYTGLRFQVFSNTYIIYLGIKHREIHFTSHHKPSRWICSLIHWDVGWWWFECFERTSRFGFTTATSFLNADTETRPPIDFYTSTLLVKTGNLCYNKYKHLYISTRYFMRKCVNNSLRAIALSGKRMYPSHWSLYWEMSSQQYYTVINILNMDYHTCPNVSMDRGSLNFGTRRSRVSVGRDPGIWTSTRVDDTVLAKYTCSVL